MERIFWAECPHCHGSFYCNHQELRHAGQRLFCPYCRARFVPEAAASLDDRLPGDAGAGGSVGRPPS